jgi:hypothetical protein
MSQDSQRKRNRSKKERLGFYWGNREPFVALPNGMRDSAAWAVLSPTQQLILLDMIQVYSIASGGDRNKIDDTGFAYAYSRCTVPCSETTFREARNRFLEIGWFDAPPGIQSMIPGSPKKYVPSRKWNQYVPPPAESQRIKKSKKVKANRLMRDKKRKQANLSRLRTVGKSCGDSTLKKSGDTSESAELTPLKTCGDTVPESGVYPPHELVCIKGSPLTEVVATAFPSNSVSQACLADTVAERDSVPRSFDGDSQVGRKGGVASAAPNPTFLVRETGNLP